MKTLVGRLVEFCECCSCVALTFYFTDCESLSVGDENIFEPKSKSVHVERKCFHTESTCSGF